VKTVVITIILLAFSVVALGVKVLFVKGGKFPSGHHHDLSQGRKTRDDI
jgi:hypothetical protein